MVNRIYNINNTIYIINITIYNIIKYIKKIILSLKGHIYCKDCLVENLFHQKTEIKKNLKKWEQFNKEKLILEDSLINTKKQEKIDNLINVQDKIAHFEESKISENV
jgi:hypothetical protein